MKKINVAGLDLSLVATAVTVLDSKNQIVVEKLIKTKPTEGNMAELKRLLSIRDSIKTSLSEILPQKIDLAVIEGMAFNARNTSALVQLAALNYFVREGLTNLGIPWIIVFPSSLKKFCTGKGNSQKNEMMLAGFKKWGVTLTNDNIMDSYALSRIGTALLTKPKLIQSEQEVINLLEKQYVATKND